MIHWEAHACLPLHPQADFAPIDRLRAAGVNYVSVNVGMDMNPLAQVMSVHRRLSRDARGPSRALSAGVQRRPTSSAPLRLACSLSDLIWKARCRCWSSRTMVALYRELGVRQMHFAYNRNNSVAGGCHDDGARPHAPGPAHGRGRQRGRRADGLLAHRPALQPRHHGGVRRSR